MRTLMIVTAAAIAHCTCPAPAEFQYALDDGTGNVNVGPVFDANMVFGNYFFLENGYDTITSIEINFGTVTVGNPIEFLVFNDPDDDEDPGDAQLVGSFTSVIEESGFNEFVSYKLPTPAAITGGFFIAARMNVIGGVDRPGVLDPQTVLGRSWVYFDDEADMDQLIADGNLAGAALSFNMDDNAIPGTWMIRATAVPSPGAALLLGMFAVAGQRRRRRSSGPSLR